MTVASVTRLSPTGLNVCFFNPHLGSYAENVFVAAWELMLWSDFLVVSISSKTSSSFDKLNLTIAPPSDTQSSLSHSQRLLGFIGHRWSCVLLMSYQNKNNLKTASVI